MGSVGVCTQDISPFSRSKDRTTSRKMPCKPLRTLYVRVTVFMRNVISSSSPQMENRMETECDKALS